MSSDEEGLELEVAVNTAEQLADEDKLQEYQIRPNLDQRFRSLFVKDLISQVLHEHLSGVQYEEESTASLSRFIANTIRKSLEGKIYSRYKLVVHVEIGEQRGAGVKCLARCLWDPDCDSYATNQYQNDSIFCVATVFGIYFY